MANTEGRRHPAMASLPLAALWLAACAVPDATEGAVERTPTAITEARPIATEPAGDVRAMIVAEAVRQGSVPPALALAVAKVGSNIANGALNAAGAVGTMQIPPALADEFDMDADDLHTASSNIRAGVACLAALQERYAGDWQLALSHYRGGPLRKANTAFAPHSFTRRYVRDVLRWWRLYRHDPLTAAWVRKAQGLPRFAASNVAGRANPPVALASRPASAHTYNGGRWRAVTGGRRFR